MPATTAPAFEIRPSGDPYSRTWDVLEEDATGDTFCRGDLSGRWPGRVLKSELERMYPGCSIRVIR